MTASIWIYMLPLTKLERVYPPHGVLSVLTTPHAPTTWGAVTDVSQLYRQHKPSTTVLRCIHTTIPHLHQSSYTMRHPFRIPMNKYPPLLPLFQRNSAAPPKRITSRGKCRCRAWCRENRSRSARSSHLWNTRRHW